MWVTSWSSCQCLIHFLPAAFAIAPELFHYYRKGWEHFSPPTPPCNITSLGSLACHHLQLWPIYDHLPHTDQGNLFLGGAPLRLRPIWPHRGGHLILWILALLSISHWLNHPYPFALLDTLTQSSNWEKNTLIDSYAAEAFSTMWAMGCAQIRPLWRSNRGWVEQWRRLSAEMEWWFGIFSKLSELSWMLRYLVPLACRHSACLNSHGSPIWTETLIAQRYWSQKAAPHASYLGSSASVPYAYYNGS